ncbi:MAG: tryptophan--tRNA ligase [Firmicutes bacterium]|nr:tryptophan--tRNA ligase [Bacillota bacterium]
MNQKKRVFSGIQPSGILTLGNYLGAMKHWARLQDTHDCVYCVVDLHALTVPIDPEELRRRILDTTATLVAVGLDPARVILFVQSHVHEHAELSWLLSCVTTFGELGRMTQFKEKSEGKESVTAGLFTYPVLMAADILLYQTDVVPVGADQKQHVELTRDIAERFNKRFGATFALPEPHIPEVGARIMSLDNPKSKMSKSNANPDSYIGLLDPPDLIRKKVSRAVTDSGREIRYDPAEKPAISNLLSIYSLCSAEPVQVLEERYAGKGYSDLKKDLGAVVAEHLRPFQERFRQVSESGEIDRILNEGAAKARAIASRTLNLAKERIGLVL